MNRWHQMDSGEVEALRTSDRLFLRSPLIIFLKQFGPNQLEEKQKKTMIMMFFDQFKDFMILCHRRRHHIGRKSVFLDTIAIVVIVALNAVIVLCRNSGQRKLLRP